MKWYTADLHFYDDSNVIPFVRGFTSGQQMQAVLMDNIKAVVQPLDELYILGDYAVTDDFKLLKHVTQQLPGIKHMVLGNHDTFAPFDYVEAGFTTVHTAVEINDRYLVHDPCCSTIDRSKWWLCGHVHDLFKIANQVINVGVDVWDMHPVSEKTLTVLQA